MKITEPTDLLTQATKKITIKMLDSMEYGETLILNERFNLYKYFDGDDFVLEDKKYDEQTICVQYAKRENGFPYIDYTDFYGYDDDEDFTNLNK
jgi:hypothetical protein